MRDEKGGTASLTRRYRNKDITLTLPEGKTLKDIKWFSVWCDEFAVNFGDVTLPSNLELPRPQKIASLGGVHGVKSDNIVIVDAQTLLVPNFSYDGEAPGNQNYRNIWENKRTIASECFFFLHILLCFLFFSLEFKLFYRREVLGWPRRETLSQWFAYSR